MAVGKMTTEQWSELKKDLQDIFDSYMIRWEKRLDEMRKRNDPVVSGKQEPENMFGSDSETQKNDLNPVLEKTEDLADEIGVDTQALTDTEPESWSKQEPKTKEQAQVKDSTKFEEDEKLQEVLDGDNFDSLEQQSDADQTHDYEVTSKIFHVINTCKKFEGAYWVFVDNNVIVNDPYGFRLLVMGKNINGVAEINKVADLPNELDIAVLVHREPEISDIIKYLGEQSSGLAHIKTQANEVFSDAWHSDAATVSSGHIANTRLKMCISPRLWYLKVNIIQVQDLVPINRNKNPKVYVKAMLGNMVLRSRFSSDKSINSTWNEELMFVVAEPFNDPLILTVVDKLGNNKEDILGRCMIHLSKVEKKLLPIPPEANWHNFGKVVQDNQNNREIWVVSRLHLRVCLDGKYHVLNESIYYSCDFRAMSKLLWPPTIGALELGVLNATRLLPMKSKGGRGTTDAYCVTKYGSKRVMTRTSVDSFAPTWNEQYTWEVYDPYTVITIEVFDNCHLQGGSNTGGSKDPRIMKGENVLTENECTEGKYALLMEGKEEETSQSSVPAEDEELDSMNAVLEGIISLFSDESSGVLIKKEIPSAPPMPENMNYSINDDEAESTSRNNLEERELLGLLSELSSNILGDLAKFGKDNESILPETVTEAISEGEDPERSLRTSELKPDHSENSNPSFAEELDNCSTTEIVEETENRRPLKESQQKRDVSRLFAAPHLIESINSTLQEDVLLNIKSQQVHKENQNPKLLSASKEKKENTAADQQSILMVNLGSICSDGYKYCLSGKVKNAENQTLSQKDYESENTSFYSAPLPTEYVNSSLPIGEVLSGISDDKRNPNPHSLFASAVLYEDESLDSSPLRLGKKSNLHSIWSRRGKPASTLQIQTGRNTGQAVEATNNAENKSISKSLFVSSEEAEEEIFTPNKENFTPNTLLMKALKREGKLEEIKHSSKITFSPDLQPEDNMVASF